MEDRPRGETLELVERRRFFNFFFFRLFLRGELDRLESLLDPDSLLLLLRIFLNLLLLEVLLPRLFLRPHPECVS